jgi:sugar phosphate permease
VFRFLPERVRPLFGQSSFDRSLKTETSDRLPTDDTGRPGNQRPSRTRHHVTWWLAVAAVLAYLCRNSLVVAESQLRADLGLSESQMGFILGPAFFWTYALAQIPTAWLGERFGTRKCLPIFSAAWSVASAMIALATGFGWVLASRLASGVAQAGLFPSSVRSLAIWKPQSERASASGILGAAMSVGGAIGAGLTGWMLGFLPATTIFAIFAIPGLIWSVGFWFWFRDQPADHPAVNRAELCLITGQQDRPGDAPQPQQELPLQTASGSTMWLEMFTSPAAWLIFGQQFFRAAGYAFFTSWFATYLMETRGVSTAQSGLFTAMPLVATVLGSMVGGYASDAIFRTTGSIALARKGVAGGSLSLCAILVFSAFFVSDPTIAVLVISTGAFVAALAAPCGYTVTMDMGENHVASVFSTMNMLGNFGAGLTPWLVPQFKNWIEASPTLLQYSGGNAWNSILLLFAVMYVGGAVCWFLISARGSVFDQSLLRRRLRDDTAC